MYVMNPNVQNLVMIHSHLTNEQSYDAPYHHYEVPKSACGENIDILRPGNRKRGLDPRFLNKILHKKSNKKINVGDGILLKDISS